jgi:hypothetical protein
VIQISQTPAEVNLSFVRGDDFAVPVVFTGVDCTSKTFAAFVFNESSSAPVFSAAVQFVNAATGSLKVVFARDKTADIPLVGNYRWCLQETTGGIVLTKLSGRFLARLP